MPKFKRRNLKILILYEYDWMFLFYSITNNIFLFETETKLNKKIWKFKLLDQ